MCGMMMWLFLSRQQMQHNQTHEYLQLAAGSMHVHASVCILAVDPGVSALSPTCQPTHLHVYTHTVCAPLQQLQLRSHASVPSPTRCPR